VIVLAIDFHSRVKDRLSQTHFNTAMENMMDLVKANHMHSRCRGAMSFLLISTEEYTAFCKSRDGSSVKTSHLRTT